MTSKATGDFWAAYDQLPDIIKLQAKQSYRIFQSNPSHPGLQFKKVNDDPTVFSVRITLDYRALGVKAKDAIVWFWIGNHKDYDRLLNTL